MIFALFCTFSKDLSCFLIVFGFYLLVCCGHQEPQDGFGWMWLSAHICSVLVLFAALVFFFPCKWPMCMEKSLTCPSKGFMFSWWITRLPHAYAFFTVRVSHTQFLTQTCRNQASSTTPIFLSFILHPTPSLTWSLTGACYPSLLHIPIKTTHPSLHIHTTHTHPSCYS